MTGQAERFFVVYYKRLGLAGETAMNLIRQSKRHDAEILGDGRWLEVIKVCKSCANRAGLTAAGAKLTLLVPNATLPAFNLSLLDGSGH